MKHVNVTNLRICCLLGHLSLSSAYSCGPAIKTWIVPKMIDSVTPPIFSCEDAPGFGVYHGDKNHTPVKNRMSAMMVSIASIGRFATVLKKLIGVVMVSL